MADLRYRYLAALSLEDGSPLGQSLIQPDWRAAAESARFRALRQSRNLPPNAPETIQPVWDPDRGAPILVAARAVVSDGEGREVCCEVPLTYFKSQAQAAAAGYVEQGRLKEGDAFHYRIVAYPCPETGPSSAGQTHSDWVVREIPTSPVCGERPLQRYRERSRQIGDADGDDYPVFMSPSVLKQAEALKEEAQDKETGGILIGYLWRDTLSPEVFAEITALIPAQHTVALSTRLTFTAETWEAVRAAIRLRRRGEIFLAWSHTHPSRFWCQCPPEAQKQCPLGRQFFSSDDRALHRAVFALGFHTALVTGDRPLPEGGWEMVHALYGWRNGNIEPRGFHLLEAASGRAASETSWVAGEGAITG